LKRFVLAGSTGEFCKTARRLTGLIVTVSLGDEAAKAGEAQGRSAVSG
jgi:hypothetical protein